MARNQRVASNNICSNLLFAVLDSLGNGILPDVVCGQKSLIAFVFAPKQFCPQGF